MMFALSSSDSNNSDADEGASTQENVLRQLNVRTNELQPPMAPGPRKLDGNRPPEIVIEDTNDDPHNYLLAPNLYVDSPRVAFSGNGHAISKEEAKRRRCIGMSTVCLLVASVIVCAALMKMLSEHDTFRALPPTQQRFMAAVSLLGAQETLEHYTAKPRPAGSKGDQEMAEYIRDKALEFGMNEDDIKMDEFEVMTNIPSTMLLQLHDENGSVKKEIELKAEHASTEPFHLYSKSGNATGPLVYAHYGTSEDYKSLDRAGVEVPGSIVIVREGIVSLPTKILLANRAGAVGILTYRDQGTASNAEYADQAAYGSVYMGNGDPSTPNGFSYTDIDRITVDEVFSDDNYYNLMPQIPSMPMSESVAMQLLDYISSNPSDRSRSINEIFESYGKVNGARSTDFAAHATGPSKFNIVMTNTQSYSLTKTLNVIITIKGTREPDRYVIVGSPRDSFNGGATSPGSGNAVFVEMLRAMADLLTNGWVPHRTLVFASFGGEQFGSSGSSQWIDRYFSHLAGQGVVYLNLNDVVIGPGHLRCEAAAALRKNIYLMSARVGKPKQDTSNGFSFWVTSANDKEEEGEDTKSFIAGMGTGEKLDAVGENSFIEVEKSLQTHNLSLDYSNLPESGDSIYVEWLEGTRKAAPWAKLPLINIPGSADNRLSPFQARLAIPSLNFHFGDAEMDWEGTSRDTLSRVTDDDDNANFAYYRAAAQLYGSVMLSYSNAVFLPYDFDEIAKDLRRGEAYLKMAIRNANRVHGIPTVRLSNAIGIFEQAAADIRKEVIEVSDKMERVISGELVIDLKRVRELNTRLLMAEKSFILPEGLPATPWLKHVLYGISAWDDYRVGYFPSVTHELKDGVTYTIKRELTRVCQSIEEAAHILTTPLL